MMKWYRIFFNKKPKEKKTSKHTKKNLLLFQKLSKKLDKLASLVKSSKHMVIFTGAGISTDAGIPDFRGPDGVWTLRAQGKQRKGRTVDTLCAIPTATHM